ncbi:hypothetical protein CA3LBN_002665 [Candidozyma haemuli]|uniref:Nucleolar protein 9 n=1 Tax=Candidozyma haemuli TaxID=45357 RepID=A0ABX8I5N7_9ASCO|nr:hypothetical protein CA3LBN_002665 [[Candida] haemuloni]
MPKPRGRREKKTAAKERVAGAEDVENDFQEVIENGEEEPISSETKQPTEFSTVFFGLVDSSEVDYFKQAESTLNINAFESDEERAGFIRSVLEESRGKELKLVTNQICSKLMERLVLFATDRQLKHIFHQFVSHFPALAHHKYSSHVLETLLVRSAALIEKELAHNYEEEELEAEIDDDNEQDKFIASTTMESMFIKMLESLHPYWSTTIEHQYASHVMRIIVLILSGKELPSTTMANSALRSKKSKIARKMIEIKDNNDFNRAFEVPASFKDELRKLIKASTAGWDTKKAREMAIHKIASPVLQLVIRVEGIVDRDRSLWHLIFLGEKEPKDSKEEGFVEYLLSDPVGSHFLESVIKNDGARMKYIERLYRLYMKDRVLKLARRATTGVYIIQALLLKLKPGEVEHILDAIVPELASLISISENQNIDLAKSIIDASITRYNYRRDELIKQFFLKFAPNYNPEEPDDTTTEFFENTLQLTGSTLGNTRDDWPTAEERRRSLFLEKLMEYDYSFVICAWYNCMALPSERFLQMCTHGVFSHVVENTLVVKPASDPEPKDTLISRKKFLNIFSGHIFKLACNSYGSHIVDKLWDFTVLLPMYKDRIGSELNADSHKVKESSYGRLVWKNWSMELFTRKKFDWKRLVKEQEEAYYAEGSDNNNGEPAKEKRPIDLKMEEIFRKQNQGEKRQGAPLSGTNSKKVKVRGRNR